MIPAAVCLALSRPVIVIIFRFVCILVCTVIFFDNVFILASSNQSYYTTVVKILGQLLLYSLFFNPRLKEAILSSSKFIVCDREYT